MTAHARWLGLALTCVLAACAWQAPKPQVLAPLHADVSPYESVGISATAADRVEITPSDLERIAYRVSAVLNRKYAGWAHTGATGPLLLQIEITRYDRGNAFLRFFSAGLGQMHIEAHIDVRDPSSSQELGRYFVEKTFAWGGIYGGVTKIEDVEEGFVQSVADGLRK